VSVALIVLVSGTLAAAAIDLRFRRIPNVLTATMAVVAVALHLADGTTAVLLALAAMSASFALGTLAFSAGWLGGGDVKLIAAACGLVSYPGCLQLVPYILIAGAILAVVQAARQRRLLTLVQSVAALALTGSAPKTRTTVPYGAAIAGGSTIYAFSTLLPAMRLMQ
jgi:prepilin peptidase CpaA